MTERQKEVVWAHGAVLVIAASIIWLQTGNGYWGIVVFAVLGPWFTYIGARELLDPNYRRENEIRTEKVAAKAEGRSLTEKEATERVDKFHAGYGRGLGRMLAVKSAQMGLMLIFFLVVIVVEYFR